MVGDVWCRHEVGQCWNSICKVSEARKTHASWRNMNRFCKMTDSVRGMKPCERLVWRGEWGPDPSGLLKGPKRLILDAKGNGKSQRFLNRGVEIKFSIKTSGSG